MRANEPLTLGLLPDKKLDWRKFVLSYGLVIFALLFLLLSNLLWPDHMPIWTKFSVVEIIPRPNLVKDIPTPKPKITKLLPPPPKFETPKLIVPREIAKPKVEEAKIEPPKIQPVNFQAPKIQAVSGAMPRVVLTNTFTGSSAPPTVNAPAQKVQTGGFGDPNGLPGQGKEGAKLTAAKLGSFDLPEGPGTGNGTGGAKGIKGTIASAGFGNGIAQPGQGDGRRNGQGVQAAGFTAQQVASNTGKHNLNDTAAATFPVEILYKPKPTYTEEARKLNLEGEVLLEVMFGANGQLHVNRVVQGLGHGLDEAAVSATNRIKFKPAQRNGQAVDSTNIVRVTFQLAS
ncbi:MAG TPA: energy transducer TonB [Terriglobales bacterium]